MIIDVQSSILAELETVLGGVPVFGQLVFEESVLRVLDAADPELPDHFIVIQPGQTEEVERRGTGSVRERAVFNITLITKVRKFAAAIRPTRIAVKAALPGVKGGLAADGVQLASFMPETPMPPAEGRRWAAHVMPLQITYVQPLK